MVERAEKLRFARQRSRVKTMPGSDDGDLDEDEEMILSHLEDKVDWFYRGVRILDREK